MAVYVITYPSPYADELIGSGAAIAPVFVESDNLASGAFCAYPAVTVTATRRVIVAFMDGIGDGVAGGRLCYTYSDDGGPTRSARQYPIPAPVSGYLQSPGSAVATRAGRVILTWAVQQGGGVNVAAWSMYSDDNGSPGTWGTPVQFSGGHTAYNYPSGTGIVTQSSGVILLPVYGQDIGDPADNAHNRCGVYRSTDNGQTYAFVRISTTNNNLNEFGMVDLGNGTVRAYIRQDGGTLIWQSDSTDEGATWTVPASNAALSCTPGQPSPVRVPHSTQLILFYRASGSSERAAYRISPDLGATWGAEGIYSASVYSYAGLCAYDRNTIVGAVGLQGSGSASSVDFFRIHAGTTPAALAGGGASLELTDGITDLTGVSKITAIGLAVGGTAAAATLTEVARGCAGYGRPVANGDPVTPLLLFNGAGDVVMSGG